MTIARSSITGRFITKLAAMLSPDTTQIEKAPRIAAGKDRWDAGVSNFNIGANTMKILRLNLVMRFASLLGVPVQVHQNYFLTEADRQAKDECERALAA